MNKEKYNQIIDKAYNDYCDSFNDSIIAPNTKEVFIDKCKHSIEYSVRWGLKIEERELSLDERKQIFDDRGYVCDVWPFNGDWHGEYDGFRIPRRAISLTYYNETIKVYE
jgi:hypothetical protein